MYLYIFLLSISGSFIVFSHVKNKKIKDKFLFKKKHVSLAETFLKIRYHPNMLVSCRVLAVWIVILEAVN